MARRRAAEPVLWEGMIWASSGILVGLTATFAAARLVAALLFDVHPCDPAIFATVDGVVTLVVFVSAAIPAVCAVNIDPTTAIRNG